jgi:hypothetical protein
LYALENRTGQNMTSFLTALVGVAMTIGVGFGSASAQTPATPQTIAAPITSKYDRSAADKAKRQQTARKFAALKQKRIECGKQASARRLHLFKRSRFIRQCMAS